MMMQLSDVIEKLEDSVEAADKKIKSFSKNKRFKAAYNYWQGVRNAYIHALEMLTK